MGLSGSLISSLGWSEFHGAKLKGHGPRGLEDYIVQVPDPKLPIAKAFMAKTSIPDKQTASCWT